MRDGQNTECEERADKQPLQNQVLQGLKFFGNYYINCTV